MENSFNRRIFEAMTDDIKKKFQFYNYPYRIDSKGHIKTGNFEVTLYGAPGEIATVYPKYNWNSIRENPSLLFE